MRFKYSYFFLPENVLKRAERQHNPVLSASLPCAERGRAPESAWNLVPLPEPGTQSCTSANRDIICPWICA